MSGWNESAWFAMVVGVALKSTAVLGAAWLAVALLRGRSAVARHLVWTAAAAALLALPILSISLPALPVPAAGALLANAGVAFQTSATARAGAISPTDMQPTIAAGRARLAPWRPDWRLWLMLSWAAGAAAAFAQMLFACAGMWRLRRSAKPSPDRNLSVELAGQLGIAHSVDVLEASPGTMPMTFGIVRPAVFLPCDASEWSLERRRIVLLHELAHVRRGDAATQLLARTALILNWWNPLAWTAWREFLKERERATDDMVLHAGARASDYASHLLEVARAMQPAPALGWAAVAMARRSQLEGRLLAILDSRVNRKTTGRASALAATLLAVAMVAPLAAVRAQENASQQAIPLDVDATIRAAVVQRNYEMLEKAASAFQDLRQYETAQKLLESAASIREQLSGIQSVDYGVGLIKLGDLEKMRNRPKEAEARYTRAASLLGDRPEAAAAILYLGLRKHDRAQALEYFQRAQRLDPALAGPTMMWTALIRETESNPAEAEALYKSALAAENPASPDAENTMRLYARFLKQQGRDDEAQGLLDRSTAVRKTLAAPHRSRSDVLRVGNGVTAPSVLSKSDPEYTEEARFAKYIGTVVVSVEIYPDGTARNIQIVRGIGLGLDENAVAAIGKWRFNPATKEGVPVTVAATIEVNFRLM